MFNAYAERIRNRSLDLAFDLGPNYQNHLEVCRPGSFGSFLSAGTMSYFFFQLLVISQVSYNLNLTFYLLMAHYLLIQIPFLSQVDTDSGQKLQ